jgi:hypothetical protein
MDNCANATELYNAVDETLNGKDQEESEREASFAEAGTTLCPNDPESLAPPSMQGNNFTLCIDNYIQGKHSFIFDGDGRVSDSTAGWKSSRAQGYIDPVTCKAFWVTNNSTIDIPFIHDTTTNPSQHEPKDLTINCDPTTGVIVVKAELYDAYCNGSLARAICPALDELIKFTPDGSGGYGVQWVKDGYPATDVYQRDSSGVWHTLKHDSGDTGILGWLDLITFKNENARLRDLLKMPPGCNFE